VGLLCLAVLITQYQNCGTSKGGSAFNITEGSSAGNLTVSAITINQAAFTPGSQLTAQVSVSGPNAFSVLCQWQIKSIPSQTVSLNTLVPIQNGNCTLSTPVPTPLGSYSLTLTVTDGVDNPVNVSVSFAIQTVSATPTPTPLPTPTPTPIPVGPTPTPTATPVSCLAASAYCGVWNSNNSCYSSPGTPVTPAACTGSCCSHNSYYNCQMVTGCPGLINCTYWCN